MKLCKASSTSSVKKQTLKKEKGFGRTWARALKANISAEKQMVTYGSVVKVSEPHHWPQTCWEWLFRSLICVFLEGKSLGWRFWLLLLETLHTECRGCWEKSINRYLFFVLFPFSLFWNVSFQKYQKKIKCFTEPTTVNQRLSRRGGVCSLWLWPCLSDSPFTVQKSWNHTDYHHICLSFCFLFPHCTSHRWLTGGWVGGLVGSVSWRHPTWTLHSADLQAAGC